MAVISSRARPTMSSSRSLMALQLRIDREAIAQLGHAIAHALFDLPVAFIAVARHAIDHFGDELPDRAEFGHAEAARGASRRAKADAR
ncbi:hypothetical protein LTR94_035815, partial [Friedmanniomyces endolithicus]